MKPDSTQPPAWPRCPRCHHLLTYATFAGLLVRFCERCEFDEWKESETGTWHATAHWQPEPEPTFEEWVALALQPRPTFAALTNPSAN